MKKNSLLTFLLLALIIVSTQIYSEDPSSDKSGESKIIWHNLDEGLKQASQDEKHLYIEFMADWCGWCRKLEKDVYTNQNIIDLLNNDFIAVRINGDSKEEIKYKGELISQQILAKKEFSVNVFPTMWILKPDGSKLTMLRGYQTSDFMQEALIYVKDFKYDTTYSKEN